MKQSGRRKAMPLVIALSLLMLTFLIGLDRYIAAVGHRGIVSPHEAPVGITVIIPGAKVNPDGTPTDMLKDRLDTALALYVKDHSATLLVSGDGRTQSRNETAVMAAYLGAAGVPADRILVDPAGYDTFRTIVNARYAFNLEKAVMTTQTFHLERAIYIAGRIGLDLSGVASDVRTYESLPLMRIREVLARVKAVYECAVFRAPTDESGF